MSRQPLWRYQPRYLVRPTPALEKGYITFGSCNNLSKLTDDVLSLWARILAEVPGSRLLIEGKNLDNPDFSRAYRQRCVALGIDSDRLELVPLYPANQYLTYHQIDIALDPFPFNGGTTTCDTLWMGVPLVALRGSSVISRMTMAALIFMERQEWLAENGEDYLRIARDLAADVPRLNAIRQGLRQEFEQSSVAREDLFCHFFGEAMRTMWLLWLARGLHPEDQDRQSQQIAAWLEELPVEWREPPEPGVGIEPGRRVPLQQAQQQLLSLLDDAKQLPADCAPSSQQPNQIGDNLWSEATNLATLILCAVPHDPVALTCLAEVEHAHGHTDFAVTYLRHAHAALATQSEPRLSAATPA